jgi:hypothetical protein
MDGLKPMSATLRLARHPGWVHSIFEGGPFGEDVGRCVPGPPHPKRTITHHNGRRHTYYLTTVGSWSDPTDPTGIYYDGRWRLSRLPARQFYQRTIAHQWLRWKFRQRKR